MTPLPAPKTTNVALASHLHAHTAWALPVAYLATSLLLGTCAMMLGRTYVPALYHATHGGSHTGYRLIKPLAETPAASPAQHSPEIRLAFAQLPTHTVQH